MEDEEEASLSRAYWLLVGKKEWIPVTLAGLRPYFNRPEVFTAVLRSSEGVEHMFVSTIDKENNRIALVAAQEKGLLLPRDPLATPLATDDLSRLSLLNEPEILDAIVERYKARSIYSYCGLVLVALNPFCELGIYAPSVMTLYHGKERSSVEPHIFVIAQEAISQLLRNQSDQSIIVSGESGSGKTVSARYLTRYLVEYNSSSKKSGIEEKILLANPILEAFGNAKTSRNENSSRFGKFLQIQFDLGEDARVSGAKIRTFLLEKSRVTHRFSSERSFHVFYQLLQSGRLPAEMKFSFLESDCPRNASQSLCELEECMKKLGFTTEQVEFAWSILTAILYVGNVQIPELDENLVLGSVDYVSLLSTASKDALSAASRLLAIAEDQLLYNWVTRAIPIPGKLIRKPLTRELATVVRDAFARELYSKLFDWTVQMINRMLQPLHDLQLVRTISILDIYGFEWFSRNGIEQFLINYANEKLQQEFIQHTFKQERLLYESEGVPWPDVLFSDNQRVLDLIEGAPVGILRLLDEESSFARGSDFLFARKVHQFCTKNEKLLHRLQEGDSEFTIDHFANVVSYQVEGFLERNRDTIPDSLAHHIHNLFFGDCSFTPPGKKLSLCGRFHLSLKDLMKCVNSSETHYVRCVKPNETQIPIYPESSYVNQQLKTCGVLAGLMLHTLGYSVKMPQDRFYDRFYCLRSEAAANFQSLRALCEDILQGQLYAIGKSLVFTTSQAIFQLERQKEVLILKSVYFVQSNARRLLLVGKFQLQRGMILFVQKCIRKSLAYLCILRFIFFRSLILIQSNVRFAIEQSKSKNLQRCILLVRRNICAWRRKRLIIAKAVLSIQYCWRCQSALFRVRRELGCIIQVQSEVRRLLSLEVIKQLRLDSRNISLLLDKINALTKERNFLRKKIEEADQLVVEYQQSIIEPLVSQAKSQALLAFQEHLASINLFSDSFPSVEYDPTLPLHDYILSGDSVAESFIAETLTWHMYRKSATILWLFLAKFLDILWSLASVIPI